MRASPQSSKTDRLRTAETPLKLGFKPTTLPWKMSSTRTGDTTALWQQGLCGLEVALSFRICSKSEVRCGGYSLYSLQ